MNPGDTLARLSEADMNLPDFSATIFETLAQTLPHQVHDRVQNDKHSDRSLKRRSRS